MTGWGRKFKAGLTIEAIWTLMFVFGRLSEDSYVALSMAIIGILFGTSVAGKFAKDK